MITETQRYASSAALMQAIWDYEQAGWAVRLMYNGPGGFTYVVFEKPRPLPQGSQFWGGGIQLLGQDVNE